MRRIVLLAAFTAAFVAVVFAAPARGGRSVSLNGGLSVTVPQDWHLVRGWLSDTVLPTPRLAVGSFPVRLSRSTCACGFPNVESFPAGGAFLFVWEDTGNGGPQFPARPRRFQTTWRQGRRFTCYGPSAELFFEDRGRTFQAELYLGPRADREARAQLLAVLDSLRVSARLS